MKLLCTTVFTLAITTASFADIYQFYDCDGNGTLLLTELDAEPGVNLSELYLGCADLNDADLTDANLIVADLSGANLYYANLTSAYLIGADLTDANLIVADLTNANLIVANLNGADLGSAELTNANLHGANLINAYLVYANLNGANLTNANLTNANLYSANLYSAEYWQFATWAGATYNDATIFPEGMNPEKYGMIYDDTPVEIDGACCVTSGCAVMAEAMCTDLGGTWTEAGSCDDCAPTCAGDINADGVVNIDDLLLLISYFGNTCM
jgi:uncharacterized protein YjbI with pentapeptide repeats